MARVQSWNGFDYSGGSGTTQTAVAGANVTAGSSIGVGITFGGTTTTSILTSVTDSLGNTYTIATTRAADTDNNQCIAMAYAENVVGGPCTITANFSAGVQFRGVWAMEFSGRAAASFNGSTCQWQSGLGAGTDNISSGNIVTTQNNCDLYGFSISSSGGTGITTAGTGYTQYDLDSTVADTSHETRVQAVAGSVAALFSQSSAADDRLTGIIAFAPATAPATQLMGRNLYVTA